VQAPSQQLWPLAQQEQVLCPPDEVVQQLTWGAGQPSMQDPPAGQQEHPPGTVQPPQVLPAPQQAAGAPAIWQSVEPAGQTETHAPRWQAWFAPHAWPQAPQFCGSVCRSKHAPPQQLWPPEQQVQVLSFGFAASVVQQPYWPGGQ